MTRKILFFINPISGTRDKKVLRNKIVQSCTSHGYGHEIMDTSKDGNYDFLKEKIKKDEITDVVICGGDGSLAPIIFPLLHSSTRVGIIPSGSGNGLARTVGISSRLDKALNIIMNGQAVAVDAFWVNDRLSVHLVGLGFDAKVAHEFAKQRKRGVNTYIKEVIKNFLSIEKYAFDIELNGEWHSKDAFMISIANSNQFGNNFKIAPRASLCDGKIDITIFEKTLKPILLLDILRHVLIGKPKKTSHIQWEDAHVIYFQANELTIRNKSKAPFHLDGDPAATCDEFKIKMIPQAYQLLLPKMNKYSGMG